HSINTIDPTVFSYIVHNKTTKLFKHPLIFDYCYCLFRLPIYPVFQVVSSKKIKSKIISTNPTAKLTEHKQRTKI
ncbi:AAEL017094-PA, partial [Aedes aegypti]